MRQFINFATKNMWVIHGTSHVKILIIALIIALIIGALIASLYLIFRSPFEYPYYECKIDVSGRRQPQIDDVLDEFLNDGGFERIRHHEKYVLQWKRECRETIERSAMRKYREKQFERCLDDWNAYRFYMTRQQTRYKQKNYKKTAYKVMQNAGYFFCDYQYLQNRNHQLEKIWHECTLREYHSKNQRKRMTRELRERIMARDNYTCQRCGKYMPDEVGLQIDHIVPISKGGKTVPSNLQVLCSRCNGSKSDRW